MGKSQLLWLFWTLLWIVLSSAEGCGRTSIQNENEPNKKSSQSAHEAPVVDNAISSLGENVDSPGDEVDLAAEPPSHPLAVPPNGAELRSEAKAFFDELVARIPNNPDSFEVKARYHFLVGETEVAKECWETALRLHQEYPYAWQGLGQIAMLSGELDTAVDYFKKAIALQENNPELIYDLADAYLRLAKIKEAIEVLEDASRKSPRSAATWVRLGQAFMADLNFEKAREAFDHALKLAPDLPQAQQGLGSALLRLGNRAEAKRLLSAQKSKRIAGKSLSEAELLNEQRTEVSKRYRYAAKVYLAAGDKQRSEFALQRATVLEPESEEAWGELIGYYVSQNLLPKAIATGQRMCEVQPNSASFHFTLGVLYKKNADKTNAALQFEEVIRLAPSSAMGYESLTRLFIESATNLNRSISLGQKCVELRGTAADHELLAQAYAVNQNLLEAKSALQKAIDLEPKNEAYRQAMRQLMRVLDPKHE